jgi:tRNA(Ile)-lysidine synthase
MARAPAALRLVADRAARALTAAGVPVRGDAVAVAVSGGADSLALLHALRTLADPRGWRLHVVTVDHGLHPESAGDAAFVAGHAAELGVPASVVALAPRELARHRAAGPEGAARAARYQALHGAADAAGCAWLATGHTRDDQAETVVLQLLRGTGPDGLAGMAVRSDRVLRPLLGVARAETRACCAALRVAWRSDPTNDDPRFLRNAVRARVLPLLEELRPGAVITLARTAELARDDRDWAGAVADQTLAALTAEAPPGELFLPCGALVALPLGLARRVVRVAAARAGQPVPSAAATDAVLALARGDHPAPEVVWAAGGRAGRAGEALLLPAREPADRPVPGG